MRFKEEDVERLMGIIRKRKVILYARSSNKDDLINQVKYSRRTSKITTKSSPFWIKHEEKRFLKLLGMIIDNEVSKVVITYPDRLVRFGLEYPKHTTANS